MVQVTIYIVSAQVIVMINGQWGLENKSVKTHDKLVVILTLIIIIIIIIIILLILCN